MDISLSRNGVSDNTYLGIHPKGTEGFDLQLDGPKLEMGDMRISTVSAEHMNLVYDYMKVMDRDIPLHMVVSETGEYQIAFQTRDNSGEWDELYLIDRLNGTSRPVVFGESIPVTLSADPLTRENRFFLSGRRQESKESMITVKLHPNPSSDVVTIQVQSPSDVSARVMGTAGALMRNLTLTSTDGMATGTLDMRDFASGIYMIELNLGGRRVVEKIIKR